MDRFLGGRSPALWDEVQRLLQENGNSGGRRARNKSGALLKGILRCGVCGCAMTPTQARKGAITYAYYSCTRRRDHGAAACPTGTVSAPRIEEAVVHVIREVAQDPEMIEATILAATTEHGRQLEVLRAEVRATEAEIARLVTEEGHLAAAVGRGGQAARAAESQLQELAPRRERLHERLSALMDELTALGAGAPKPEDLRRTLESFDPVWAVLEPAERLNLVRLIVAQATYDGGTEDLELRFTTARAMSTSAAA